MDEGAPPKKKEIYSYKAPWTCYTMAWCRNINSDGKFKMAVGSFVEEYSNQIQIIQLKKDSQGNGNFYKLCTFEHPYPPTKIMWAPPKHNLTTKDLLATTGDYLRVWTVDSENSVEMKGVLNNNKNAGECV
jgi:DDB1- and CUL4-associated factor 7